MHQAFKIFLLVLAAAIFLLLAGYFYLIIMIKPKNITWGVNFSQMQAEALGLNWKETYLEILEDLKVKDIKLITQWDWVEGKKDHFYFSDIDWQIKQAEDYSVKLIYVVGMKTGRWPECHIPEWAGSLSKTEQQDSVLAYIKKVVLRYKDSKNIVAWQAENEPLFKFGRCPWYDKDFLAKEVALIKSLDPSRPVIVTDSGDQSWWFGAAKIGDKLGITLYRKVWFRITDSMGFYLGYIYPPQMYGFKARMINVLFGKKVFVAEFQAEPWLSKPFYDVPLADQEKSMNLAQFKSNINFAKKTGLDTFYFWGTEWWHWLKEKQNKPEIWEEAKKLF